MVQLTSMIADTAARQCLQYNMGPQLGAARLLCRPCQPGSSSGKMQTAKPADRGWPRSSWQVPSAPLHGQVNYFATNTPQHNIAGHNTPMGPPLLLKQCNILHVHVTPQPQTWLSHVHRSTLMQVSWSARELLVPSRYVQSGHLRQTPACAGWWDSMPHCTPYISSVRS